VRIPFRRRPWLRAGLPPLIALACVLGTFTQADAAQQAPAKQAHAAHQAKSASHQRITERHACARPDKAGYAACFAIKRTDPAAHPSTVTPDTTPPGYSPANLQSAYNLPSSTVGTGQTVAIVDAYDDPNAATDMNTYRTQYGLPACTEASGCFTKADQRGGTNYPIPNASWSQEISLDLDMVSAACPNCHILLVEADDNSIASLGAAVDEAVALGAKFVSNSYGAGEDPAETGWDTDYYDHPGVAVTASTGDYGYGAAYPATSPDVTAVGGTSLTQDTGTTRGWTETAWSGAGSGCSAYEAKPAWQTDTGCTQKTEADVSAVADPATGVAVYDSYQAGGWSVFGGTSAASPLIAATYALAGTPVAGTNPASYPYANPAAINDVTSGSNGTCSPSPAYLCTAGPGYDGPTGLGTPAGVAAFKMVDHGTVSGTVTDAASNSPVAGVQIAIDDQTTTTDSSGRYSLAVPVGSYSLTATKFGYATKTVAKVKIAKNQTVALGIQLTAQPTTTISGTVTDGSAHHWPLYARVSIPGTPAVAYSNPVTGHYSLTVLQNQSYTLDVDAHSPGYQATTQQVSTGTAAVTQDIAVPVDASTCSAPGYHFDYSGQPQTFDGGTAPDGWTVTNNTGTAGWEFSDPGRANNTGGSGGFAIADSLSGGQEDTELVSPVTDLSSATTPILQFNSDLEGYYNDTAGIDLSTDGGQTWTNVWEQDGWPGQPGPQQDIIPLPAAAGQSQVQVRFHFTGDYSLWWELDNIFLGNRSCDPVPGGLVTGRVTDKNTGAGVAGATVTGSATSGVSATTEPAGGDPATGDGFYSMFYPGTGSKPVAAAMTSYTGVKKSIAVTPDAVTTKNFALPAGQFSVSKPGVTVTTGMGSTKTATFTVTNTGTAPATANISEEPGSFTQQQAGAPVRLVKGTFSLGSHAAAAAHARPGATPAAHARPGATPAGGAVGGQAPAVKADKNGGSANPADPPWSAIADYPTRIMDESLVTDPGTGQVYSVGGFDGTADTTNGYVYDPAAQTWTAIAPMRYAREHAAAAWINGRIYVAGGWDTAGDPVPQLEIYDPATNTWSSGAAMPAGLAASGVAVYNARLYVIGGCDAANCDHTNVQVYDPAANSWSAAASYPEPASWLACGTLYGQVDCAGGQNQNGETTDAFSYDPAANQWSQVASLPIQMAAMSYATSGGRLLVSGGITQNEVYLTNQAFSYDPDTNAWTALPNANYTVYRAASACGLYTVGGSVGGVSPIVSGETLPGYGQCAGNFDVGWLTESGTSLSLAPGQSKTVTLTFDAADSSVTQPGAYDAELGLATSTPYPQPPVYVTLNATPPKTWGKITGTLTGANCDGTTPALAGAVVQVDTWAGNYTLLTDANGHYGLWLDKRSDPLTLIATGSGWQPQTAKAHVTAGTVTTRNFTLKPQRACS
jgi:N-acetylneuraminic acid mutarotase